MKSKLIIKVVLLAFSLGMVILAMQLFASNSFKDGVNQMFSTDTGKTMRWCPNHVVDFQWQDPNLAPAAQTKWSHAKPEQVRKAFCSVTMDTPDGTDLTQLQFKPLLMAQSAEAKTATLEWNPESRAFRVQGMPFKSASLSRELLDDPK